MYAFRYPTDWHVICASSRYKRINAMYICTKQWEESPRKLRALLSKKQTRAGAFLDSRHIHRTCSSPFLVLQCTASYWWKPLKYTSIHSAAANVCSVICSKATKISCSSANCQSVFNISHTHNEHLSALNSSTLKKSLGTRRHIIWTPCFYSVHWHKSWRTCTSIRALTLCFLLENYAAQLHCQGTVHFICLLLWPTSLVYNT